MKNSPPWTPKSEGTFIFSIIFNAPMRSAGLNSSASPSKALATNWRSSMLWTFGFICQNLPTNCLQMHELHRNVPTVHIAQVIDQLGQGCLGPLPQRIVRLKPVNIRIQFGNSENCPKWTRKIGWKSSKFLQKYLSPAWIFLFFKANPDFIDSCISCPENPIRIEFRNAKFRFKYSVFKNSQSLV